MTNGRSDTLVLQTAQGRRVSTFLSSALRGAFPAESSTSRQALDGVDRALVLGLFAASSAVLALRGSVAFSKLWADDGVFLARAARGSPVGPLFSVYHSYLAVIPRVLAALIVQSPTGWWAVETAVAAIAVTAWAASVTFLVARWYIPQRAFCALLALSVSLVPALRTESINSITNQHFVLIFAAFWLYLAPPRNAVRTILRSVAVVLIGLSSPLLFVMIPLPIARAIRFGKKELPLLVATGSAVLVQASFHFFWNSSTRGGGGITAAGNAAADYTTDVFESTFGGYHPVVGRPYAATVAVIVAIGTAGFGLWWLRRVRAAREEQRADVAVARTEFLMMLSMLLSGGFMIVSVQLGGTSYRYAITPSLFLCTFLVASASRVWTAGVDPFIVRGHTRRKRHIARLIIVGVSILVLLGWARGFSSSRYRRSGPTWSASLATARSTCRATNHPPKTLLVPIAPGHGRVSWYIDLDCASL
jgi:hypothetical protein